MLLNSAGMKCSPLFPTRRIRVSGLTLIEVLISLAILVAFGLGSTYTLNLFDDRAAQNRNAEAARAAVDDYVNYLLRDDTPIPAATAAGTDVDGDGVSDGVLCTSILSRTIDPKGIVPLIVSRANATATSAPIPVVTGTLYWRVQAVGTAYGLSADTKLARVDFTLVYTWRNRNFYYKALTFKTF